MFQKGEINSNYEIYEDGKNMEPTRNKRFFPWKPTTNNTRGYQRVVKL